MEEEFFRLAESSLPKSNETENTMTETEEKPKAVTREAPPLDACPKHQKKPGRFWSSCPECHVARRKHHQELRQRGEHPEDSLIQTATSKALENNASRK
jgi:hypothetical protein